MRITQYDLELNDNRVPCLVKEQAFNYGVEKYISPEIIVEMINKHFRLNKKAEEYVYIFATDNKCHPIGIFNISKGVCNGSFCNPREIMIRMLMCGCVNMFMIHNHPSHDTTPSNEDIQSYRRIKDAADLLGITFTDNIIIGGNSYLSFSQQGIN